MASPIAALVVRVLADVSEMKESVKQATDSFDGILRKVPLIGAAMASAFTVTKIVEFGRAIMDDADALMRMSDQTGIGVEAIQRLRAIADESGNSIEQLTGAISQMQNRLAEGDTSAVGALNQLGLSLDALMKMAPDQQFMAIARAIAEVEDPMQRTKLAMDLFGKAGAQILPSLIAEVDKIAASTTVMSEEGVKKWDALGDAITRFWRNFKATVGNALITTREETAALEHMADVVDGIAKLNINLLGAPSVGGGLPMPAPLNVPGLPTPEVMRQSDLALARLKSSNDKLRESQRESRQEHERMVRAMADTDFEVFKLAESVRGLGQNWSDLEEYSIPTRVGFNEFDLVLTKLGNTTIPTLDDEMDRLGNTLGDYGPTLKQLGAETKGVGDYLDQVESILGGVQTAWAQMVTVAVRGIRAIAQNLAEGDWIGAIVAGVTSFGQAIANAFRDEQHERVNDLRDEFQRTFGTFDDMAAAAHAAGYQIERLLDTKKVEDFDREMRAMTEAIQFQEDAMAFLEETFRKYGFSIDEAGEAWARAELDKQAQLLYREFTALRAAGVDIDIVIDKMSGNINAFIQDALRTGTEVPAAMAPMLQRMVEMGLLTDENGNIITDLEEAGVRFSMTMSEGFQRLINEVSRLTDAITRGLGRAIASVPDIDIDVNYRDRGYTPEVPLPGYANGTGGRFVDFGAGTPVVLHGRERVVTEGESMAGGGGLSAEALIAEFRSLRTYMQTDFAADAARAARWARQVS